MNQTDPGGSVRKRVPTAFRGHEYKPIRLKALLQGMGVPVEEIAREVHQTKGVPLSRSALCQILNHNAWPKSTPESEIRRQIEAALRARGIPDPAIVQAFEADDGPSNFHNQPTGAHVGVDRHPTQPSSADDFPTLETEMLTLEAREHFSLSQDPFLNDVTRGSDVFLSNNQRYVLEAMRQTAILGGITVVIGESGGGKTTLRKLLLQRVRERDDRIRIIAPRIKNKGRITDSVLSLSIIHDLDPEMRPKMSLEDRDRQAEEVLIRSAAAGYRHLLLIEEAHDLQIPTLKALKRFVEIESDDLYGRPLGILLLAQPEIRIKLNAERHPEAREFINRCEVATLEPLYRELEAYVEHKFARVGAKASSVLAPDAYDAIRARWTKVDQITRAVRNNLFPLTINRTLFSAMNLAAKLGAPLVTGDIIREL